MDVFIWIFIIIFLLVIAYLLFHYGMAILIGRIIYNTPKFLAPTKEQVYKALKNVFKYDISRLDSWEKVDFQIKSKDGFPIVGEYYPIKEAKGIAVIVHGFGQNRYIMIPYANILRDLGFITIVYDQRGFGVNRGQGGCTFGIREGEDCAKVIEWARSRFEQHDKVILCGASMGAISVINSQLYTKPVDAIIADSSPDYVSKILKHFYKTLIPFSNPFLEKTIIRKSIKLGLDMRTCNPIEVAKNINVPVLIMHGAADRTVPVDMGKNIRFVLKNPLSEIEIFEGYDHTIEIAEYERYKNVVTKFLTSAGIVQLKAGENIS